MCGMTETIAVIGAGLMGSGIAQVSAVAGHTVILRDIDDASLQRGVAGIEKSLTKFAAKGVISDEQAGAALARISTTTDLEAVATADIVVEAVFEKLDIKTELFGHLDRLCRDGAILATNTSAIPITTIAAATSRPEHVVGTHFFSPVPMMRLVELVRGYKTTDETMAAARSWAEGIGKTVVVVNRDVAGFVTTRLITVLAMEAIRLVESGIMSAEDLDTACELAFGHPMGPLKTGDMTGLDIMMNASANIYEDTQREAWSPPELIQRMVSSGDLGRKSGQGFYSYQQ